MNLARKETTRMEPLHSEILRLFTGMAPLEPIEVELITKAFKPFYLKKGEYFLRDGEVSRHVAYLAKGLVRYYVLKDGHEATFEFTKEGEFISDYQSFMNGSTSIQNIQAIEDCTMLVINRHDVLNIYEHTKHGNLLGRLIVEHRFEVMVTQLLSIYMHTHEQRYMRFLDHYKDINQRIPLYLIASYVGIQPQSLSRMRRRFAKRRT